MNKNWLKTNIVFCGVFLAIGAFAAPQNQTPLPENTNACLPSTPGAMPAGGGGETDLPFPFDLNRKVELADREKYLLVGVIQLINGMPVFEVDLKLHPWLASRKRKAAPFYPILNSTQVKIDWSDFEGSRVKLLVEARAKIMYDKNDKPTYMISVYPLREPTEAFR